ncbi:uncharacterized protein Z519_10393 [Cladophialophora bantiana CBS 173.52]|uniref:PNPLA domain-containing protein n=1 Tax=Cladophialophora bantiana (strain ATCC 10958 / CBS 173.52 / CDC B-1940 / NIH 8579) TaxID=1442370 RepID=A0A0D2HWH9_CLAB1|nr:uncharacterized protein Z519_10393 [Cladophialophora bantiana CBS 173.52]KIW88909.1 hypothetical protein Z519_10393 [Cladophialophora bantiana CBS 173.52]
MGPQAGGEEVSRSSWPIAMLSLDGGGVRGLSSLLILQRLLLLVTQILVENGQIPDGHTPHTMVNPQEIFDIAVGTSTGGLIVLMMVKLDMSLDKCIQQYKKLSRDIFSKQRPLLKRIFGSDWSKYSGRRLEAAVEGLLKSSNQPVSLEMRSKTQQNTMRGTVLCHEMPQLHSVFFCTDECQGPYQQHMLKCDLKVRHAARATSAAPSYFEEVIIEERAFVDGGYGKTNNPSWESRIHYEMNHEVPTNRQLVMINIGTGTLPQNADVARLRKRPWWTMLLPKGLVKASGLFADLISMATESEGVASDLEYLSKDNPERLFFKRFSANTGIHDIKLDDWQAVAGADGSSVIEQRTEAYLSDPVVLGELKAAAEKLAEIYVKRQELKRQGHAGDIPSAANNVNNQEGIDLSVSVVVQPAAANAVPSLVTGSEPTQSPGPSPPRTPEVGWGPPLPPIDTAQNKEILQGQGGQFEQSILPTASLLSPASPNQSAPRKVRRAVTYPPRSTPPEEK